MFTLSPAAFVSAWGEHSCHGLDLKLAEGTEIGRQLVLSQPQGAQGWKAGLAPDIGPGETGTSDLMLLD